MSNDQSAQAKPSEQGVQSSDLGDSSPKVEALISQLSEEEQQDAKVLESQDLLFDKVNAEKLREREEEYTDIEKHWVRNRIWLKIARELFESAKAAHGGGLRYFTLPGSNRLDVELLLKEKLLEIDPNDPNRIYVAGFETDPSKFGLMAGRSPYFKFLANCSVEEALTDRKNPYYSELQSLFPFDVINLDLTTSLTPKHEGPYSTTMQAINALMKRQSEYKSTWALF